MLREIAVIDAKHGGYFADRDGDGIPEFITADWSWAYALSCFACIRYPDVILKFDGKAYSPAPDLMRTAIADSTVTSEGAIGEPKQRDQLWSIMLQLIYTGHATEAWAQFEACWNDAWGDRRKAMEQFQLILVKSEWWPTVRQLNAGDPLCIAINATAEN